ncbi:MAG: hypothetical protein EA381_13930 [Planctomycetaceae bacterium]|nr:MAG: hypothetical protein EA381_13930 [Planctomycetaceae bacterium]
MSELTDPESSHDPGIGQTGNETRGFDSQFSDSFASAGFDTGGFSKVPGDSAGHLTGELPSRVGDYRIDRLIGSGGMGRVYLAEHATMLRTVALKTLPMERMRQPSAVDRFYAEIRVAARLLHPNIVTAFDAGFAGGVHYLAMEFVNGCTLSALVGERGPLAIGDAVSAIRDAARGLAHAHAAGIVHRDVKPSNLMRAQDGTVKLLDLGLASVAAGRPESGKSSDVGRLIGTIAFMSPEQLENPDAVDARSDIYSLGATFYFLLTGRPPYGGEFLDQVRGHRHDPLPELFAVRPDADLRLEHVLHRMMAKKPQDRYASLIEVIADLAVHDEKESIPAWISGLGLKSGMVDSATLQASSTRGEVPQVMAIDFGMFFATAAVADPSGKVELLLAGGPGKAACRIAIADGTPPLFADAAQTRRAERPGTVMHCLPLFVAQTRLEHVIAGRRCPAEVLMGLQLRQILHTCWNRRSLPRAMAITVPSCYDQLHRQAILQAASIAGFRSVRLVDRPLAALHSWQLDHDRPSQPGDAAVLNRDDAERPQVVISVSGSATEVVIVRRRGPRPQQLAAIGQWHYGMLQWQQKLVDLGAAVCRERFGIDPLTSIDMASSLQLACEQALPRLIDAAVITIRLVAGGRRIEFELGREQWLEACEPLFVELLDMISTAFETANVSPERVRHVLLLGLPTRFDIIRQRLKERLNPQVTWVPISRGDIARGAAACVAGELPGRGELPLPPQAATCHDLGLLVIDSQGRRRIRPVIPRGTLIPARTTRRIASGGLRKQTLMLVESSSWRETAWRSLGAHGIATEPDGAKLELMFEVDIDGRLIVRGRNPQTGSIERLPPRPQPTFDEEELIQWGEWVAELLPAPKRSSGSSR